MFVERVRKNKVKQPTERGYSFFKWEEEYKKYGKTDEDKMLYSFGIIVVKRLEEIREKLNELRNKSKKIKNEEMILAHCAASNRDRALLEEYYEKYQLKELDNSTLAKTLGKVFISNNKYNIEVGFDDLSTSCVDGFSKGLYNLLKYKKDIEGSGELSVIDLLSQEMVLSQLYEGFEAYWKSMVWGGIDLYSKEKRILICQRNDELQLAKMEGVRRKEKIYSHSYSFVITEPMLKVLGDKLVITQVGSGKKKKFKLTTIRSLGQAQAKRYASILVQEVKSFNLFPKKLLEFAPENVGFSIKEILEVFKVISVFAIEVKGRFPKNSKIESINDFKSYSPKFKFSELCKATKEATELPYPKVKRILNFLTFNAESNSDLWCNPLIQVPNGMVMMLVAPLLDTVISRCVEKWFQQMGIDTSEKGFHYEEKVYEECLESLRHNPLMNDYDIHKSKKFHFEDRSEEIDLVIRIGGLILICEAKCIVGVDSEISFHNTLSTLKHASEQAQRKAKYAKKDIRSFFKQLKWDFQEKENYQVYPLVINSSLICSGFSFFGVVVTDTLILNAYFKSNKIPLLDSIDDENEINYAHVKIYNDVSEASSNMERYLTSPPQLISLRGEEPEYHCIPLVSLEEDEFQFMYCNLNYLNQQDIKTILSKDYNFEVIINDEFDLEEIDVLL